MNITGDLLGAYFGWGWHSLLRLLPPPASIPKCWPWPPSPAPPHMPLSHLVSHILSLSCQLQDSWEEGDREELWTEPPMKPETFACLEESRLYRLALPHLVLSDLYTVHQSSNVEVIAQLWYCCNFRQRLFKKTYLGQWLHLTFSLDWGWVTFSYPEHHANKERWYKLPPTFT